MNPLTIIAGDPILMVIAVFALAAPVVCGLDWLKERLK
jgi:hypothetical protein